MLDYVPRLDFFNEGLGSKIGKLPAEPAPVLTTPRGFSAIPGGVHERRGGSFCKAGNRQMLRLWLDLSIEITGISIVR